MEIGKFRESRKMKELTQLRSRVESDRVMQ
jgi:hypothetical protein